MCSTFFGCDSRTCGRGGSRRGPGVRRALAMAVAVPVLTLAVTACGGGDDGKGGAAKGGDGGKKKDSSQGQQTGGGTGASKGSGGGGGSVPSLDAKQLTAALLKSGDVKGYRVQRGKKDALPLQNKLTSDDPRCSAIADAFSSTPKHARTAYAGGTLVKGALSSGGAVQQVLLAAYGKGEAAQWMGELKKSLGSCRSFKGTVDGGTKTRLRVERGAGAGVGDDSVRFTLEDAGGKSTPTDFTVVRTGGNTATYVSISLSGKPVPVAKAVLAKQHEKLTAAAKN